MPTVTLWYRLFVWPLGDGVVWCYAGALPPTPRARRDPLVRSSGLWWASKRMYANQVSSFESIAPHFHQASQKFRHPPPK